MPCRLIKPTRAVCVCACVCVCVCTYVQLFCLCNLARTYTHLSQKGACTQHATVCKLMRHILKFTGDFMLRGDQTHARLASRTGTKIWKGKNKKKPFVLKSTGERSEQNRGKKKKLKRELSQRRPLTLLLLVPSSIFKPPHHHPSAAVQGPLLSVTWAWYAFCHDSQRWIKYLSRLLQDKLLLSYFSMSPAITSWCCWII